MAVYTEVPDDALSDFVALYDIGRVLSFKGIAEGVENSNYLLHTQKGAFILTLYEKRVREEDLPFFIGLMEHLAGHGVTCPQPVRQRDGGALDGWQAGPPRSSPFSMGCGSGARALPIAARWERHWRGCIRPARISR